MRLGPSWRPQAESPGMNERDPMRTHLLDGLEDSTLSHKHKGGREHTLKELGEQAGVKALTSEPSERKPTVQTFVLEDRHDGSVQRLVLVSGSLLRSLAFVYYRGSTDQAGLDNNLATSILCFARGYIQSGTCRRSRRAWPRPIA